MKQPQNTSSYMLSSLHLDGIDSKYLKIPTYYDEKNKEFMGFVRLPQSKKMIYAVGKTSKDLEQNFNATLRDCLQSEYGDELFALYKTSEEMDAK